MESTIILIIILLLFAAAILLIVRQNNKLYGGGILDDESEKILEEMFSVKPKDIVNLNKVLHLTRAIANTDHNAAVFEYNGIRADVRIDMFAVIMYATDDNKFIKKPFKKGWPTDTETIYMLTDANHTNIYRKGKINEVYGYSSSMHRILDISNIPPPHRPVSRTRFGITFNNGKEQEAFNMLLEIIDYNGNANYNNIRRYLEELIGLEGELLERISRLYFAAIKNDFAGVLNNIDIEVKEQMLARVADMFTNRGILSANYTYANQIINQYCENIDDDSEESQRIRNIIIRLCHDYMEVEHPYRHEHGINPKNLPNYENTILYRLIMQYGYDVTAIKNALGSWEIFMLLLMSNWHAENIDTICLRYAGNDEELISRLVDVTLSEYMEHFKYNQKTDYTNIVDVFITHARRDPLRSGFSSMFPNMEMLKDDGKYYMIHHQAKPLVAAKIIINDNEDMVQQMNDIYKRI